MLRRETIIALRARHSAFRVAADVMFPPQAAPEPVLEEVKPPPPLPTPEQAAALVVAATVRREWIERLVRRSEQDWQRRERMHRLASRAVAIIGASVLVLFVVFMITAGIVEGMKDSPPPPTVTN